MGFTLLHTSFAMPTKDGFSCIFRIERIKKKPLKMKKKSTDDFLREGKIILDRLQSFSVDMAKIFTPKMEETIWQRYNNGDKTAFMRHITKELSASQVKKIKELIKVDPEFKLAVSRYMAEFEGMTKAAKADKSLLAEVEVLQKVKRGLEDGLCVRALSLNEEEAALLQEARLLTQKPIIYVTNISEDEVSGGYEVDSTRYLAGTAEELADQYVAMLTAQFNNQ